MCKLWTFFFAAPLPPIVSVVKQLNYLLMASVLDLEYCQDLVGISQMTCLDAMWDKQDFVCEGFLNLLTFVNFYLALFVAHRN